MVPTEGIAEEPEISAELKDWRIPFLGRETERQSFKSFLDANGEAADRLTVSGDSGTGKSYLVRTCLFDALQANSGDYFCLYVDLSNDEFQSSRLISSLLKLAMVAAEPTKKYPLKIPTDLTLEEFKRKSTDRKSIGWNVIRGLSQAAASFVCMGEAAREVLSGAGEVSTTAGDILSEYLKWVASHRTILLAVDNYQFMNLEIRLTLESLIGRVGTNIKYIIVDRTIDGVSQIVPPLQSMGMNDLKMSLGKFDLEETKKVVAASVEVDDDLLERLSSDLFSKTDGLPTDLYRRQNRGFACIGASIGVFHF